MKTRNTLLELSIVMAALSVPNASFGFEQALVDACFNNLHAADNPVYNLIDNGLYVSSGKTYINCGEINTLSLEAVAAVGTGVIENYGLINSSSNLYAGSGGKIINRTGGTINLKGGSNLDFYGSPGSSLINEGTINLNRRFNYYYDPQYTEYTSGVHLDWSNNSVLTNSETGYIRIDSPVTFHTNAATPWIRLINYGKIEITKNGSLDLTNTSNPNNAIYYIQDGASSQMIVNGLFIMPSKGASNRAGLNNGVFKGTGVIKGNYDSDMGFTIAPGDEIGTLTFDTPELALNFGTMLDIEIGGRLANQMKHDVLNVTGNLKLQGTLNIYNHAGFAPQDGQTYTIIKANNITGQFFAINGDNRFGGRWSLQYNPTSVVLVYNAQ